MLEPSKSHPVAPALRGVLQAALQMALQMALLMAPAGAAFAMAFPVAGDNRILLTGEVTTTGVSGVAGTPVVLGEPEGTQAVYGILSLERDGKPWNSRPAFSQPSMLHSYLTCGVHRYSRCSSAASTSWAPWDNANNGNDNGNHISKAHAASGPDPGNPLLTVPLW